MAIAFLTLNGVGIGHLNRSMVVCEALRREGQEPVVFSQGIYPHYLRKRFPGKRIKALGKANLAERSRIVREVASYASLSTPSIVFEDTHPARVKFADFITRILIVRPTDFRYMCWLARDHGPSFKRFLVCDHPDSPTWPFQPSETAEIASWEGWEFAGPIFRSASAANFAELRSKYSFAPDQRVYVFSMGGGGTPKEDDSDIVAFVLKGTKIAELLRSVDPNCRLIFVRGPLFPRQIALPEIFESVSEEPRMAELLALADGAIIRPGYNTIWECLRGHTPFVPIPGSTYMEPVDERLSKLERLGLTGSEWVGLWGDRKWKLDFGARVSDSTGRWTGQPNTEAIRNVLAIANNNSSCRPMLNYSKPRSLDFADENVLKLAQDTLKDLKTEKRLLIRIDAVVELSEGVLWLLDQCQKRKVFASIEIVPYLSKLSDRDLDRVDPNRFFEVSQHGYANLMRIDSAGHRGEFWVESEADLAVALDEIATGFNKLSAAFPERFQQGLSPPHDGVPPWLDSAWKAIGGRYLTVHLDNRVSPLLPAIRFDTSLRVRRANQPRPLAEITSELVNSIIERGYAGIVAWPQLGLDPLDRVRFVRLLDAFLESGVTSQVVSVLALTGTA